MAASPAAGRLPPFGPPTRPCRRAGSAAAGGAAQAQRSNRYTLVGRVAGAASMLAVRRVQAAHHGAYSLPRRATESMQDRGPGEGKRTYGLVCRRRRSSCWEWHILACDVQPLRCFQPRLPHQVTAGRQLREDDQWGLHAWPGQARAAPSRDSEVERLHAHSNEATAVRLVLHVFVVSATLA